MSRDQRPDYPEITMSSRGTIPPLVQTHYSRTWHFTVGTQLLIRAGPGVFKHTRLTRLLNHVAIRGKLHRKNVRNHDETTSIIFGSGQRSGHQRSSKVKFFPLQHFSTNRRITQEPEELHHGKAHSIVRLTLFRYGVFRFDLKSDLT